MKGYDFSRRQNRKLKDKQWDWADEEFRRLWDVIYNKREQYAGQTSSTNKVGSGLPKRPWFTAHILAPTGSATSMVVLSDGAGILSATAANTNRVSSSDPTMDDLPWGWMSTASTVNAFSEMRILHATGATGGNYINAKHSPYLRVVCKTDISISNLIIQVGFRPTAKASLLPGDNGDGNAFIFCYNSSVGANWNVNVLNNGSTLQHSFDTGLVVAPNTTYIFEINVISDVGGADAHYGQFIINDTVYVLEDGTGLKIGVWPSRTAPIHPYVCLINKVAGSPQYFKIAKIYGEWGNIDEEGNIGLTLT